MYTSGIAGYLYKVDTNASTIVTANNGISLTENKVTVSVPTATTLLMKVWQK